jgi:hypothetical protein
MEKAISGNDLYALLAGRRARLLELAPTFLTERVREQLVDQILTPRQMHGLSTRMVCSVLADALNEGGKRK